MKHPIYGYSEKDVGFTVDLVTRKITFQYEDYNFCLLSECRDDIQQEIRIMLDEDKISLGILDTESEYCNVVMFGLSDVWENPEDYKE
jgi:hypothetical protein